MSKSCSCSAPGGLRTRSRRRGSALLGNVAFSRAREHWLEAYRTGPGIGGINRLKTCTQTAAPFAQKTRAAAARWEAAVGPPELGRNSSGDPGWMCTDQSCKFGNKHSYRSCKDCENTGTFKTAMSRKRKAIWKADSHTELFLGFQSGPRTSQSWAFQGPKGQLCPQA